MVYFSIEIFFSHKNNHTSLLRYTRF